MESNSPTSRISATEYKLEIEARSEEKFTTYFIGTGGKILAKSYDTAPVYRIKGDEGYVRARVDSSYDQSAWTQPTRP